MPISHHELQTNKEKIVYCHAGSGESFRAPCFFVLFCRVARFVSAYVRSREDWHRVASRSHAIDGPP